MKLTLNSSHLSQIFDRADGKMTGKAGQKPEDVAEHLFVMMEDTSSFGVVLEAEEWGTFHKQRTNEMKRMY